MTLGNPNELQGIQVADSILQDFKGLDCSACNRHFGFQNRVHPHYLFCSSQCLSVGKHAIGQLGPIPLTSPAYSGTSCDKELVFGLLRGRNSGSNRGGRIGGNINRSFVRPGQYSHDSQIYQAHPSSDEDFVDRDGIGRQPLKDLTEQALNDAFEKNIIKSNGFVTVEQQEETRSAFLADARKPQVPNDENSSLQKPTAVTDAATQKQLDAPKEENKPTVPVPHLIEPVAIVTAKATPAKSQNSETAPLPNLVPIKKPGSVQAAGATNVASVIPKPIAGKKIWTIGDLAYSISLDNMVPCNVAYIWDATKYHLQAQTDESNLETLQMAVVKYCEGAPAISRIPSINEVVFAPYEREYCRGKVTSVDEHGGTINVLFIDYGDEQKVKLTDCREPLDELMIKHPIYGVVFSLTLDMGLLESIKNSPIPEAIKTASVNNSVYMIIDKKLNDHFTGKLHINENKTFNDIINDIIKKASPAPTTIAAPIESELATYEIKAKQSSQTPPPRPPSRAPFPMVIGQKAQTPTIPAAKWKIQKAKFSEHLKMDAVVHPTFIWNLSKLNITADADETNFEQLQAEIDKFVSTAPEMTRSPQIDEIVLAPYEEIYYRGRVEGIEGSDVHVVFLDYGDEARVKLSEIKEPSDELMKHPLYGVCIRMLDVPEDVGLTETQAIAEALQRGGHVQVDSQNDSKLWTGHLWISGEKTWSDLANEAIKSQGK